MQIIKKTWNFDTPYLDEEMAQGLLAYNCAYKNNSYLYCLLEPVLNLFTNLITTKAFFSPNKTLVVAFLIQFAFHIYTSIYAWSFSGHISRIPLIFLFLAYTAYTLIEGIATKVAKGPSEMFFVQAFKFLNLMLITLTFITLFQVHPWYSVFLLVSVSTFAFYETLQHYFLKRLHIPAVNVTHDLSVLAVIVYLMSIINPGIWKLINLNKILTICLMSYSALGSALRYFARHT
eukprot:TRINITY_DN5868_c0_g1_i25.p1 TRINITY_DN5868_c0_g1~~TRINITY_DN5868_c0_g1_i25.p1  ORF type:complete len:233 (-),score=9.71 TRINITY_DN5868_c0_g1_i25:648-1346(-)